MDRNSELQSDGKLHLSDLVPSPIVEALATIGLNERYFNTLWFITRRLRLPTVGETPSLSRPFKFLSASTSVLVTIQLILATAAIGTAQKSEPIGQILSEHFYDWLKLYGACLVTALVSIHLDMALGLVFPLQGPRVSYLERLHRWAYVSGWSLSWSPLVVAVAVLLSLALMPEGPFETRTIDSWYDGSEHTIEFIFGLIQLELVSRSALFDVHKFVRLLIWITIYMPIIVFSAILIFGLLVCLIHS